MTESLEARTHPRGRIVVFAREPRLGQVKSRLAKTLGAPAALALYRAMLARVGSLLQHAGLAPWDLWVTSNPSHKDFITLCNATNIYLQKGADLGARMDFALSQTLDRADSDAVILIGTDCPALSADYLHGALAALESGSDVVLGPAEDGGYVLIGARRPISALFEAMPWGSDQVLARTLERLADSGLSYHLLETLWDVDYPDDIPRLKSLTPPLHWETGERTA